DRRVPSRGRGYVGGPAASQRRPLDRTTGRRGLGRLLAAGLEDARESYGRVHARGESFHLRLQPIDFLTRGKAACDDPVCGWRERERAGHLRVAAPGVGLDETRRDLDKAGGREQRVEPAADKWVPAAALGGLHIERVRLFDCG